MINRNNAYLHEWIGSAASVDESPNPTEVGISGEIMDETKNTLVLLTQKGERRIAKRGRSFSLHTPKEVFTIKGSYAAFRPEDRIKERRRINRMIRNGE